MSSIMHPFHLVEESPFPLLSASSTACLTTGFVKWFSESEPGLMVLSVILLFLVAYQWWRDISREGGFQGAHPSVVEVGLRSGMLLFITSEVFFFLSFFWAFFHSSISPNVELGEIWPPLGITPFSPLGVPYLNTLTLLTSGLSVTWAHYEILKKDLTSSMIGLSVTLGLGVFFIMIQMLEYKQASFTIADSSYGSTFFIATGFHGLHVIVGVLFLSVALVRLQEGFLSPGHHFGFEAAAWYWHFVDVVWLFLYLSIYGWGNA